MSSWCLYLCSLSFEVIKVDLRISSLLHPQRTVTVLFINHSIQYLCISLQFFTITNVKDTIKYHTTTFLNKIIKFNFNQSIHKCSYKSETDKSPDVYSSSQTFKIHKHSLFLWLNIFTFLWNKLWPILNQSLSITVITKCIPLCLWY